MTVDAEDRIAELTSLHKQDRTPYFMAQLRWALHCYRWRQSMSWNDYPQHICSILEIPIKKYTKKEKEKEAQKKYILDFTKETVRKNEEPNPDYPINLKDPKIWIIGGKEPTKEEKIKAYVDFLKKEAPEYLEVFTDDLFINKTGDFIHRFYSPKDHDDKELEKLSKQASYIEQFIFLNNAILPINYHPRINGNNIKKARFQRLTGGRGANGLSGQKREDYNKYKRFYEDNMLYDSTKRALYFESETVVIAFRKIGASPFLKVYIWGTDCLKDSGYRSRDPLDIASMNDFLSKFLDGKVLKPDDTNHKNLYTGILCPAPTKRSYFGILKTQDFNVATIQMIVPVDIDPDTHEFYADFESEDQCLTWRMCIEENIELSKPSSKWVVEVLQEKSMPYKIDCFQNYVANLNV